MTYCDFHVKQGQNTLKVGTWGIFESGRSNMTSVFEIEQNFINYAYMRYIMIGMSVRYKICPIFLDGLYPLFAFYPHLFYISIRR